MVVKFLYYARSPDQVLHKKTDLHIHKPFVWLEKVEKGQYKVDSADYL